MAREMREMKMSRGMGMSEHDNGCLYMQTNEIQNCIVHYHRAADGVLSEVERVPTGGAGSGAFKPISGPVSAPNAFDGGRRIMLTAERRFMFTTRGGGRCVSSNRVGEGGRCPLFDVKSAVTLVEGTSGSAKSLAYAPSSGRLFVL